MSYVPEFHSVNEIKKPPENQVHHNNGSCGPASEIPANERGAGTGDYRLCEDCEDLNDKGL